jgi:hypothetical protein
MGSPAKTAGSLILLTNLASFCQICTKDTIFIEFQLSGGLELQPVAAERSALKQPTEAKPCLGTLIMLPYP